MEKKGGKVISAAASGSSGSMLITIVSKDFKIIKVDKKIAFKATFLKQMLEDRIEEESSLDEPLPISNFSETAISKVFEFIKHEVECEKVVLSLS